MKICSECGNNCKILSGVLHHIDSNDRIDSELDSDHVAEAELTDYESNRENPILSKVFNFHSDGTPCLNFGYNSGGYEKYQYFICADGGVLSIKTVINEFSKVNFNDQYDPQWHIVGVDVNYENNELIDSHSGEYIESAY